uniref:Uncharacterized protein n=1 Tax=Timema tahoe TaxID=61484 RepID=A0A7R9ILY7_9NEOP|nr:unnamed protein product [Timema tahoe]
MISLILSSSDDKTENRTMTCFRVNPGPRQVGTVPVVRRVESRTLSCQTGSELLLLLVQSHSARREWAELSPRALLESAGYPTRAQRPLAGSTPHILEESGSEHSGEEDSGQLRELCPWFMSGDVIVPDEAHHHQPRRLRPRFWRFFVPDELVPTVRQRDLRNCCS